jgi:hypothetical protein
MAITFDTAVDSILTTLKVKWDAATPALNGGEIPTLVFEAIEQDLKPHPKDSEEPWARAVIRHADAFKATLANDVGTARYRRVGLVWVQVFTPSKSAQNWTLCQQLAMVAQTAYEGRCVGDVVYTKATIFDSPKDGPWWRYDMRAEFYWDEIR